MRIKSKKEKKKLVFLVCLLLTLALGLGYAVLSEQLKLNGTVNYGTMAWDVGFTTAEDGGGSIASSPTVSEDKKSVSITCNVGTSTSSETCIAKAKVKNLSSFAVKLESDPTITYDNTYISSVTSVWSENSANIVAGDSLAANVEKEITVTITTKELTEDMLPESNLSFPVDITMDWIEANADSSVDTLKDKTAIFFGDSVAYGYETNGNGFGYYVDQHEDLANYTNAAVSSATINTDTKGPNNIIEQMINHKNESYDYVIIEGGFGDLRDTPPLGSITSGYNTGEFDTSTFAGAVEYTLYLATKYWKNSKIGFIVSYFTPNSNQGIRTDYNASKEYWDVLKAACDKWNVDYLDLFEGTATYNNQTMSYNEILKVDQDTYIPDGVHLNEVGYQLLVPYIAEWMKTISRYQSDFEVVENDSGITYPDPEGYTVVRNFADLSFTKDKSLQRLGNENIFTPIWGDSLGRASAIKYLVRVNGGETIGLSSAANNVYYAIGELDYNVLSINPFQIDGAGQYNGEWLSGNLTLNTKTKYITVSFKNGDGTTSFTDNQIALLPTYIEFK